MLLLYVWVWISEKSTPPGGDISGRPPATCEKLQHFSSRRECPGTILQATSGKLWVWTSGKKHVLEGKDDAEEIEQPQPKRSSATLQHLQLLTQLLDGQDEDKIVNALTKVGKCLDSLTFS